MEAQDDCYLAMPCSVIERFEDVSAHVQVQHLTSPTIFLTSAIAQCMPLHVDIDNLSTSRLTRWNTVLLCNSSTG